MDKRLLLILLGAALLSSCTENLPAAQKWHTGNEGLVMRFVSGSPPKYVFPDEEFSVLVEVSNEGAFSVARTVGAKEDIDWLSFFKGGGVKAEIGILAKSYNAFYLRDITDLYMPPDMVGPSLEDLFPNHKYAVSDLALVELAGSSEYLPQGDTNVYEYVFRANPLQGQIESPVTQLFFTLCYPYRTYWSQAVCIDKDIHDLDKRAKVCTVKDISLSQGQGAPVAITRIEPRTLSAGGDIKVNFNIYFENKAGGMVLRKDPAKFSDSQAACLGSVAGDDGTIPVRANLLNQELDCSPIRFKDNKARSTCRSQSLDTNAYGTDGVISGEARNFLSHLYVEVDYMYQSQMVADVEVVREDVPR
ncbi:MAG: hypothetical protein ABIH41_05415 [Nanoarchaeota archaeon]